MGIEKKIKLKFRVDIDSFYFYLSQLSREEFYKIEAMFFILLHLQK